MKYSNGSSQRGMALLISLVVLIVVSILGATAMRSAAFQSKVSVNAQASQILFQGAESGLAAIDTVAENQITAGTLPQQATHIFAKAYNGVPQRVCYNGAGVPTAYSGDTTRTTSGIDTITFTYPTCAAAGSSQMAVTSVLARPPCSLDYGQQAQGYSMNNGSGGWGYRTVYAQSFSQVGGLGYTGSHVQLWLVLAPSSGLTSCS